MNPLPTTSSTAVNNSDMEATEEVSTLNIYDQLDTFYRELVTLGRTSGQLQRKYRMLASIYIGYHCLLLQLNDHFVTAMVAAGTLPSNFKRRPAELPLAYAQRLAAAFYNSQDENLRSMSRRLVGFSKLMEVITRPSVVQLLVR